MCLGLHSPSVLCRVPEILGRVKRNGGIHAQFELARGIALAVFGFGFIFVWGGAFGQVGYGEIEPYMDVDDEYFAPTPFAPHGQHWLITTGVVYAWRLVGYDQPWAVDHNNPNRTIAFIDSGIDMDHPEFGGDGATGQGR